MRMESHCHELILAGVLQDTFRECQAHVLLITTLDSLLKGTVVLWQNCLQGVKVDDHARTFQSNIPT